MIKDMPLVVFSGSLLDSFVKISLILILIGYRNFFLKPRFLLSTLLLTLYVSFSYLITDSVIRIMLLFVITIFLMLFILKFRWKIMPKLLIINFFVWMAIGLMDVMYSILFTIILNDNIIALRDNVFFILFSNALIFFSVLIIFYIPKIRELVIKASNLKTKQKYVFIIIILSAILFSVIFYLSEFHFNPSIILSVIFIMVVIYTIVVLITIKEFNQRNKLQSEYDVLLTNLSEYEKLLDVQRISNHENKNQLLVIRGMVEKGDDASQYINSLIETQYNDNEQFLIKTNRIPSGGLKGLIYYKIITMKDKGIDVSLETNNVDEVNFSNLDIKTNQELCKIIGVFLDNAIQEVENLTGKHINIIFKKSGNQLIVKISNNYGFNDLGRIGEKGYTTKGKGHGYGLRLVNSIVNHNKLFEHTSEITGKVFSQIVKLNIEKD